MKGTIFGIEHFAVYDGEGIRTVVYLKGCPLRCLWCHNPEGFSALPQIMYNKEKCVLCGNCAMACTKHAHIFGGEPFSHVFDRKKCIVCGACTEYCFSHALIKKGEITESSEVVKKVLTDAPFFGEKGGITLSGGEPTMQAEFSAEILALSKKNGITTCVETCGHCEEDDMLKIAEHTDLFLFDIKETDENLHRRFTGVGREKILANLYLLNRMKKRVVLRCPVIPNLNMREEHCKNVAFLAEEIAVVEAVELEPYHPIGLSKYAELDEMPKYDNKEFLSVTELKDYVRMMRKITEKPVRLSTGEKI